MPRHRCRSGRRDADKRPIELDWRHEAPGTSPRTLYTAWGNPPLCLPAKTCCGDCGVRGKGVVVPGLPGAGANAAATFDPTGKVLHSERIAKMVNREPPRVTIVPLPAPQGGAIIVGMFRDRLGWSLLRIELLHTAPVRTIINPNAWCSTGRWKGVRMPSQSQGDGLASCRPPGTHRK
jgi:hypothetical protein